MSTHKSKNGLAKGLTRGMTQSHRQVWKDKEEPEGLPLTREQHQAIMRAEAEESRLENKRLREEWEPHHLQVRMAEVKKETA